jgi:glyoxylase-like metal-dependent hydrolase (beta-lactamase superfamily II)
MQWNYLENPGIDSSLTSLQKIGRMKPSVLFPSHGDVILNPAEEIHILSVRLENLQQYLHIDRAVRWNWSDFIRVSAHVVQDCGTTSQFVIAPGGEALMFDCGDDMTPERLESLKKAFGIRRIDVIIPSHWHYDHVNGIPAIVAREGSKVWVWNKLAEHLEHPERFPTTCWNGIRIQVDRLLEEGQFNWSGYNFSVYPNPVHMEEQMALSSEIDGLKFYFIGDGSAIDREGHLRSALHCYNGISLNHALIGTAMSFHKAEPYICIAAHSNGFGVPDDAGAEFLKWAVNTTDAIRAILPSGFEETSFNPYWASFYPARTITKPGDKITLAFRIKNDGLSGLSGRFSLNGYDFLTFNNPHYPFLVLPGETKDIEFSTVLSERIKPGVYLITADILCNGRLYREFAEGYVEVGSTPTTTNIQPEL